MRREIAFQSASPRLISKVGSEKTIAMIAAQPNEIIVSASSRGLKSAIGPTTAIVLITNVANERPIGLTANGSHAIDAALRYGGYVVESRWLLRLVKFWLHR